MVLRIALLLIGLSAAQAQTRRALLVGIDRYAPASQQAAYKPSPVTLERAKIVHGKPSRQHIPTLDGSVNDASAIREMLLKRFDFKPENITLLSNADASADNILATLQKHLIDEAQPGDISFFYYAGHGSRIANKSTQNSTGLDSTIVPQDSLLGAPDIRGKELAALYLKAAAKRITLTVIQDSCYSGAVARGGKTRSEPQDPDVWVDEQPVPTLPEEAGVLILSAAQDYQFAQELGDSDLEGSHGAFTWALLHVLGTSPPDASADAIFRRTRALMQSVVSGQEPVLLARHGRDARGLFGQPANMREAITIAVAKVDNQKQTVQLNGGAAMALRPGCELATAQKPAVSVRILSVKGAASSDAQVIAGNLTDLKAGDLLELKKWVAPDADKLKLFVGPTVPASSINDVVRQVEAFKNKLPANQWVGDPTVVAPSQVLQWNQLNAPVSKTDTVYVKLPLPAEAAAKLSLGPQSDNNAVTIVDKPELADYVLASRIQNGAVEYAWAQRGMTEQDEAQFKNNVRPLRTEWFPLNNAAESLSSSALKLCRILGWQTLESPNDSGFPYDLAIQDTGMHQFVEGGQLIGDRKYKLFLRQRHGTAPSTPRRVYVFVVDSFGQGTLLFPAGNLDNQFPSGKAQPAEGLIELPASEFKETPPYGWDSYILLSTDEPIDNPDTVFSFQGVRTRGGTGSPLTRLLRQTGSGSRGVTPATPVNWSVQKLFMHSVDAAAVKDAMKAGPK